MKKNYKAWHDHAFKKTLFIMRLVLVISLICIMQSFALESYTQNSKISLSVKQMRLEDILMQIESDTRYRFAYNKTDIDVNRVYTVNIQQAEIKDVLNQLFSDSNITYSVIDDRQVVLSRPGGSLNVIAQSFTVSGKITDSSGSPLPGVSVVIKGTPVGVITDAQGNFSLLNVPSDAILVFSFVGMKSQEVAVAGKKNIHVTMEEETFGIEEVVAIGYGMQKKATLTGATASVQAEALIEMPNPSLAQKLEGRASGVRVSQGSSITGASAKIRIRGSSQDPLYVIDDVVMEKEAFDDLTAEEVESINFMKDAATSSVYGARAANGVVVVKTKRGRFNQKAQFNYNGSAMVQYFPLSVKDFDFSFDKVLYMYEAKTTGGFHDSGLTDQEKSWLAANPDFNGFGNIREWLWHNPKGQQHSISASGGSDNISYFASLGYERDQPGFKNGEFSRYNFRSSLTAKITPTVTLEWISDGYIKESNRPFFMWQGGEGLDESASGLYAQFDYPSDQVYAVMVDKEAGTGRIATLADRGKPGFSYVSYAYAMLEGDDGGYRRNTWRNFNNKVRLTWDLSSITRGLKASVLGNYSVNSRFFKEFSQYYDIWTPALVDPSNRFVYTTDLSKWGFQHASVNQGLPALTQKHWNGTAYQYNFFLNYDRSFGLHNLSGLLLYEAAGSYDYYDYGQRNDMRIEGVDQLYNFSGNSENTTYGGNENHYARSSYVGRFSYNYDEKYLFQFSWRNDASSLFPQNSRWGFFPSVSAGWRIDKEDFFNVKWISELKPRFSYGTSGSEVDNATGDPIGGWQFRDKYELTGGWEFGSGKRPGLQTGVMPNPHVTWAKTSEYNVGIDLGLFENKLTGSVDYFYRKNTDKLGTRNQQFPSTWGASLPAVNYASDEVRGVDLSLGYQNKVGQLSYRISANASYAKDKVLILDENPEIQGTWRSQIGKPASIIWGYHSLGVIKDQATLDALPDDFTQFGRTPEIGDLLLKDIRGVGYSESADGKVDGYDNDILSKNGSPRIVYGFTLGGTIKGFSLDAHFSGVGAFDKYYGQAWGAGSISRNAQVLMERWHPTLNPDGWAPAYRDNYWDMPERGHGPTSTFLFNASYLRLKNLVLGYDLPGKWINATTINGFRVYISATDLFVLSKWFFGDPETASASSYPRMKTLSCGVNVTF